jgi:hypothetical protein
MPILIIIFSITNRYIQKINIGSFYFVGGGVGFWETVYGWDGELFTVGVWIWI